MEEEEEEQEEVEDDLSTSARDCNRRRVCARARHVLRGDRECSVFRATRREILLDAVSKYRVTVINDTRDIIAESSSD